MALEKITVLPVSEAEMEMCHSGPAVSANRFYIFIQPSGVRVVFGDQWSPEKIPNFRNSVLLSYQDAIQFASVLKQMVEPIERQISAAGEAAKNG